MLRSVSLHWASVGITIHQAHMRGSSKPGSEGGQSTAGHAQPLDPVPNYKPPYLTIPLPPTHHLYLSGNYTLGCTDRPDPPYIIISPPPPSQQCRAAS
jgi:hypothetical protein